MKKHFKTKIMPFPAMMSLLVHLSILTKPFVKFNKNHTAKYLKLILTSFYRCSRGQQVAEKHGQSPVSSMGEWQLPMLGAWQGPCHTNTTTTPAQLLIFTQR